MDAETRKFFFAEARTPTATAGALGVTTRQLRSLEARGLPVQGTGRAKRYPWPAAIAWFDGWRWMVVNTAHRPPERLNLLEAAEHWLRDWDTAVAHTWLTDPERARAEFEMDAPEPWMLAEQAAAKRLIKSGLALEDIWPAGAPLPVLESEPPPPRKRKRK